MTKSLLSIALSALFLTACASSTTPSTASTAAASPTSTATPTSVATSTPTTAPAVHVSPTTTPTFATVTASPFAPTPSVGVGQVERQWAQVATATTNYGATVGSSWNASQATGAPNATCSDDGKAWASAAQDTIDTLTLTYADRVIPTSVRVVQSFNPGRVSKVTVSGGGQTATVYTNAATAPSGGPCVILDVPVTGVAFAIDTVAVTVDQTRLGSWAEIDAVELVGTKA